MTCGGGWWFIDEQTSSTAVQDAHPDPNVPTKKSVCSGTQLWGSAAADINEYISGRRWDLVRLVGLLADIRSPHTAPSEITNSIV